LKQNRPGLMMRVFLASLIFLLAACTPYTEQHQTPIPISDQTGSLTPLFTLTPTQTPAPAKPDVPEPTPTTACSLATDTPPMQADGPIVYYYFVEVESESPPAGSVIILPEILILAPAQSDAARSPDSKANIGLALQTMINDPRNAWTSTEVSITSVTFEQGTANVALDGEYFGAGDIVLIAARAQILLTVFAEASVQTATITLNGENIANLGISHSSQVKPTGYAYTRADIETFVAENAYEIPAAGEDGQINLLTTHLEGIWQHNRSMGAGWAERYHFYPSGTFHYFPNEMTCSTEKIEQRGAWDVQDTILTLTITSQIISNLEIYPNGLCSITGQEEVNLVVPLIEQFTIIDHGTLAGELYPSISINDLKFWKFSDDASRYGDEIFPED
jgi:hypothetical protein